MSSRFRRLLVLTAVLALALGASGATAARGLVGNPTNTRVAGINVDQTTIPQLEALMNSHRINAVKLTNFYLRRIRQTNATLHAVITVSPTAHADALAADRARRSGDRRPLLGMPIIVKDNIDTTGMPTTAGSWALAGSTPPDASRTVPAMVAESWAHAPTGTSSRARTNSVLANLYMPPPETPARSLFRYAK